jgi:hypothetical protein
MKVLVVDGALRRFFSANTNEQACGGQCVSEPDCVLLHGRGTRGTSLMILDLGA